MPSRSTNPIAMAFNILEEYQKPVRGTLVASGCSEELQRKILSDLYATDEVYLSINRPYKREIGTFADFCARYNLHFLLKEMFPQFKSNNLYSHQVQAIQSILDACTTIISTGTGSGKTESFLIPILDHCLKHRGTSGIKALILYPINALAGDRLRRIKEASEQQGITVGSFIGSTPQSVRNHMISNPPDILITNYVMLDRLITKERPRSMFERSKYTLRFLVVDEIHYYRGTKGANLCLLLRRLRTLCADKGQLVQIGASATLRQGGGYYSDNDQEQIETFARSLFGQEATQRFKFITPIYDDFHPEEDEDALLWFSRAAMMPGDPHGRILILKSMCEVLQRLANWQAVYEHLRLIWIIELELGSKRYAERTEQHLREFQRLHADQLRIVSEDGIPTLSSALKPCRVTWQKTIKSAQPTQRGRISFLDEEKRFGFVTNDEGRFHFKFNTFRGKW